MNCPYCKGRGEIPTTSTTVITYCGACEFGQRRAMQAGVCVTAVRFDPDLK